MNYEKKLKEGYDTLATPIDYGVGDFVVWKDGMKNRKMPEIGQKAIVTGILSEPVYDNDDEDAGMPSFREPLDLKLLVYHPEAGYLEYYYDSRRFRKAN